MRSPHARSLLLLALSLAVLSPIRIVAGNNGLPFTLNLAAVNWTTIAMAPGPVAAPTFPLSNLGDGSLAFPFPVGATYAQAGSIDYLYTARRSDLSRARQIVVDLSIYASADAVFHFAEEPANTCPTPPANVRVFFWSNNDKWGEFDRWWSVDGYVVLANGTWQIVAPIDPTRWTSVYGKSGVYDAASANGWNKALAHVSSIGLTAGGGCFAGHGAYSTAPAQFVLQSYRVE